MEEGPAGLETARVAALRGHQVTIYEKEQELGGQIRIGRAPPHRAELGKVTDYLFHQVKKAGVQIEPGTEITPSMINGFDVDAIVLASGALPSTPGIKGVGSEHVVYAFDVIAGKVSVGKKVVVVGGGLVGVETADFLVSRARK